MHVQIQQLQYTNPNFIQDDPTVFLNVTVMAKVLEMTKLDLDDDMIIAIENGSHVDLFEFYKIAENQGPIEHNSIGVWSDTDGLQLTNTTKWYRRGNLKVF